MSNDTQVKQDDRELIEAIAEPWICVEEKPCEEAVAVHWAEMVTSLTEALATVRREEREAAGQIAFAEAIRQGISAERAIAIKSKIEASASKKEGRNE